MLHIISENLRRYSQKFRRSVNTRSFCVVASFALAFFQAQADPFESVKARLSVPTRTVRYPPVALGGTGTLTIESPSEWYALSREMLQLVRDIHSEHTANLGDDFEVNVDLRLMDEEAFFRETGAPRWTNAMYYRGQVMIPLPPGEPIDFQNIYRSVRHEYTHAVVHAASAGICPGWLDEGYATYFEGEINADLTKAYNKWLRGHDNLSFGLLQGGFTKLETAVVPAAYAQSLYAAKNIIEFKGHKTIGTYFKLLRQYTEKKQAFLEAFGENEATFESRFNNYIKRYFHAEKAGESYEPLKEAHNQLPPDLQSSHGMVNF